MYRKNPPRCRQAGERNRSHLRPAQTGRIAQPIADKEKHPLYGKTGD